MIWILVPVWLVLVPVPATPAPTADTLTQPGVAVPIGPRPHFARI